MNKLVEGAIHSTYQLSPTGSGRLRRLTAASGLANDNVLSRVAIATSLADPKPLLIDVPLVAGKGKEIKGSTLLGRPGPASLLVALMLRHHGSPVSQSELRNLIIGHWERGLGLINSSTGGGSVVDQVAEKVLQESQMSGPGSGPAALTRDALAASLGREFGRLPVEVRRLLALVGRFDLGAARAAATRLLHDVGSSAAASGRVSESQAMRVLASWGLNRLGMTSSDSQLMDRIYWADGEVRLNSSERGSAQFLANLGFIDFVGSSGDGETRAAASNMALSLGPESWRHDH